MIAMKLRRYQPCRETEHKGDVACMGRRLAEIEPKSGSTIPALERFPTGKP